MLWKLIILFQADIKRCKPGARAAQQARYRAHYFRLSQCYYSYFEL